MSGRGCVAAWLALLSLAGAPAPVSGQTSTAPATLVELLPRLADDDFRVREETTRRILALGPGILEELRTALAAEADPEIRRRLAYVLENIVPPQRAVLVVRADDRCGLRSGDIITHVNTRRVEQVGQLRRMLGDSPGGLMVRVQGVDGTREVGPVAAEQLVTLSDYRVPVGETIARIVRLYDDGLAEQAADLLARVSESVPETELDPVLRARIVYTAGQRGPALALLGPHGEVVQPAAPGNVWSSPSLLDLVGPGKAPFHLEMQLWSSPGAPTPEQYSDPDLRVQRVLVPARRFGDALDSAAQLWWLRFREGLGRRDNENRVAGNMLAVIAWMLWELDLQSECMQLIEPRSKILGTNKWVRVQLDSWQLYLRGDTAGAVDSFYDEARAILQRPPAPNDPTALTRNPRVAATFAFFLYQLPQDPRVNELLRTINRPGQPALDVYVHWMVRAAQAGNQRVIRDHLLAILPNLPDAEARDAARIACLLEYVQDAPDLDVLQTALQRYEQAAANPQDPTQRVLRALLGLAAGRPGEVAPTLADATAEPGAAVLLHTARFVADVYPAHAAMGLGPPLLALPLDPAEQRWLLLARDRRILVFDVASRGLTAVGDNANWFPGPLNWPWLGQDPQTRRVWRYGPQRVVELTPDAPEPVRLNLRNEDILAFDRWVRPHFGLLAEALADRAAVPGEDGDFLRADVSANHDYIVDPDLPELSVLAPLAEDARVLHLAVRGGPQLLIAADTGRSWTTAGLAQRLALHGPLVFFPVAAPAQPAPLLLLASDQGLIRLDCARDLAERVALPGDEAYPALVPECTPYSRRDPRWVYFARRPEDGGRVYRLTLATGEIELVDMINEALPREHVLLATRGALRAELDERLTRAGLPKLAEFLTDAAQVVSRWKDRPQ